MPDAVIGAVVANGLDRQAVGGKWFLVIDEMCFRSDDLKRIIGFNALESYCRKITVPYRLGGPVLEDPVRRIFETEQALRKDRDAPVLSADHIFRPCFRMCGCNQFLSHM